jgi:carbonic anhydrase/acetyltransferase-like protein (isoleucine patch superfamily)
MAIIKELRGVTPSIGKGTFLAENSALIGSVTTGEDCSIWYGAVLRGDVGPITLGNRVNIQDGACLHATTDVSEVRIGDDVSVGHNAIVHGAIIGNDVLIGMGAVVMDNAVVPDGTIVAAGAVVLAGTILEPGIWAGVPAKKVKDASEKIQAMAHDNARHYLTYKEWYE